MAKTKTPFFSMGSSGTIGRALTSQKRAGETLLRAKPTPTDPYSLAQAYQRWLYQDYCAEWLALSASDKQIWRSAGSRCHLTGMSCFLRNRLTALADIAGGWHLDFITGNTVLDFGKNLNHGTVYGATLVDGLIDHALSLDGVDDWVDLGTNTSLYPSSFTYEALIKPSAFIVHHAIISVGYPHGGVKGAYLMLLINGSLQLVVGDGVDLAQPTTAPGLITANTWAHVAGTFDGENIIVYVNGKEEATGTQDPVVYDQTVPGQIGRMSVPSYYFKGAIDHALVYNRVLTPSDILRHSLRKYP